MEQVMVNFRMDAALKREMEATCREMGMSLTTAFTIFAKKVTREKRIPFEVSADVTREEAIAAIAGLRRAAARQPDMTLDEINAEIRAARQERKAGV
ncbi:MAG: type II toxin-antitoxin system RelB/DinJ family antitoxin [Schwartzia sp.]|nr:type II toxin-antitoxin system RelB/DinJ family antitoxin [Schwartzia sp. (in: firmicutes)]